MFDRETPLKMSEKQKTCKSVNVKNQISLKNSSFFDQLFLVPYRTNSRETIFVFEKFAVSLQK
ncbi:hypothetical protein DDZ16_08670 [Marinilabilia rubra]|uniref:Uncharacterized protein n=1 Tax=Marinilabilia rubra TaxID=2162893 RepID=A0A2U2BA50_9BACT|nr:hypothetical protein DDZ16_08670 [Marinilabilia rubra]